MRKQKRLGLAAILASGLLVWGCNTHTGGGWILSVDGESKATFGFELICDEATDDVSGELQYNDHGTDVQFHGIPDSVDFGVCGDSFVTHGEFFGTYTAQPEKLGSGRFRVLVEDGGEPGPSNDDYFEIELFGGPFGGYFNAGFIEGGNIQAEE